MALGTKDSAFDVETSWTTGSLIAFLEKQGDGSFLNKNISIDQLRSGLIAVFATLGGNPYDNTALANALNALQSQITALQGAQPIKKKQVASEAEMVNWTQANPGDEAIRSDQANKTYILSGGTYNQVEAWIPIEIPGFTIDDFVDPTGRANGYVVTWDAVNNKAIWSPSAGGDIDFATETQYNTATANVAIDPALIKPKIDAKLDKNTAITPATKPKVQYDADGLIVAGFDLTVSDIPTLPQSKITGLTDALDDKVGNTGPADNTTFVPDDQDNTVDGFFGGLITATRVKIKDAFDRIVETISDVATDLQSQITALVTSKQNKLVAGTNITIDISDPVNPVISSTGGGTGPATTDALAEGTTNKYFTEARVRATPLTGLVKTSNADILSTDSVLVALGKAQAKFDSFLFAPAATGIAATDTANLQAAIDACPVNGAVWIPFRTNDYLVTGLVINKKMTFAGNYGRLRTTSNATVLDIQANEVNITFLDIEGDGPSTGKTNQIGIKASEKFLFTILGVRCQNLGGKGIYFDYTTIAVVGEPTATRWGGKIFACTIKSNNIGIESGIRGEYVTIASTIVQYNATGLKIAGGNVTVTSTDVNDNGVGVHLVAGENHAHGIVSGCNINHNVTYAVICESIIAGHSFVGCHIIDGLIYLKNCQGVRFMSCGQLAVKWRFEGGDHNVIQHSVIRKLTSAQSVGGHGYAVENNYNSVPSHVEWIDNQPYPTDAAFSETETIKGGRFQAQEIAQTIANAATANIDWGTPVFQATSNNLVQTKYTFYNSTEKSIQAIGLAEPRKKVSLLVKCQIPVAGNEKLIYARFQTFGGTVRTLAYCNVVQVTQDATNKMLQIQFEGIIRLSAAEKFVLLVGNNSGQTLTFPAASSERVFIVEGL